MNGLSSFTKQCVYDCYNLMKDCVDFEHIEDSEFIYSMFKNIERYRVALPPSLYKLIECFIEETLYPIVDDPDFFSAVYSPEFGEFNEEGDFYANSEESSNTIISTICQISDYMDRKVDFFAEQELMPYLL